MLITLPNSVAAIELGTAAAAAVVRPLFFFEFFFAAILIPTRSLSKLIFDHERISRTGAYSNGLTAMVNQPSPRQMVDELRPWQEKGQ
jgi:hypothetical protein